MKLKANTLLLLIPLLHKRFFGVLFFLCVAWGVSGQALPKREFRGAWIVTLSNIDYPSESGLSVEDQQKEFDALLDVYEESHINAIIVQVRPQGDAFYNSALEPWSQWLTGEQGKAPENEYDPLSYMTKKAHARGMELHAWINPFRGSLSKWADISEKSIIKRHPEWVVDYGQLKMLDPGIPEVRDYITAVVQEVVQEYEVDAIHFDDYFYPYYRKGKHFDDDSTYALYHRDKDTISWRRENIDLFVKQVSDSIKATKPQVKFGISPFGIWRNIHQDARGSHTNGTSSYDEHYADSRKWLQEGWVDYCIPQVYWTIDHNRAPFDTLVDWWANHHYGKHVYVGQSLYKVAATDNPSWNDFNEIPNQIDHLRSRRSILGSAFFSTASLLTNVGGVKDSLERAYYKYPALLPTMPWIDSIPPNMPRDLRFGSRGKKAMLLEWEASTVASDGERAMQYVVYRFPKNAHVTLDDPRYIFEIVDGNITSLELDRVDSSRYRFGVTALDKLHNESPILTSTRELLVRTRIDEVTVFPGYAQVHRSGRVNLPVGQSRLMVHGLSGKMDPNSLLIDSEQKALVHEIHQHFLTQENQFVERRHEIVKDSLAIEKRILQRKRDSLDFITKVEIMIRKNNRTFGDEKHVSADEIKKMAKFFMWKMNELSEAKAGLSRTIGEKQKVVTQLHDRLQKLADQKSSTTSDIELLVSTDKESVFDLRLTYLVDDAQWEPVYDLEIVGQNEPAHLTYKANIKQNTGVSWDNVNLTLASRQKPSDKGGLPILKPINVTGEYSDWDTTATTEEVFSYDDSEGDQEFEKYVFENKMDSSLTYVNIPLSLATTIDSDNSNHLIYVKKVDFEIEFVHHAIPKFSDNSYLTGFVHDWEKHHIKSGWMNVYMEGAFWGKSVLNVHPNIDTLELLLGREQDVVTTKSLASDLVSQKLFGMYTKEEIMYEIQVHNIKNEAVKIILEDQVPVSFDSRIDIKPVIGDAEYDAISGKIKWHITLSPEKTETLKFGYSIKYPNSMEITYE